MKKLGTKYWIKCCSAMLCLFFAVVLLILSINTFDLKTSIYYENETYGGDAYTGIQNATAATARRVANLNNTVAYVGGGLLLMGSFAFFACFIKAAGEGTEEFRKQMKENTATENKVSELVKQKEEEEENKKFWVCECGAKNMEHATSCKGCGGTRSRAVMRGDGGEYKKCSCGAMVKQGEKCPLCGAIVY